MDALRFVPGLSTQPSIGARPLAATPHVGKTSAPAQVSLGPFNQRNHPYMFFRPLGHMIWPGNGSNQNNDRNTNDSNADSTTRKERKFQEAHGVSLESSTTIKEDEEEEREKSLVLNGLGVGKENILGGDVSESEESTSGQEKEENWVMKILRVRSIWEDEGAYRTAEIESDDGVDDAVDEDQEVGCPVNDDDDEEEEKKVFDRDSFGRLLNKVSLNKAKFYAKMSYLSSLSYCIQRIESQSLLKLYGFRFVTSSLENKKLNLKPVSNANPKPVKSKIQTPEINPSVAYNSVASAASYLHSIMQGTSPVDSDKRDGTGEIESRGNGEASFVATTNSVTAMVSANEETKDEFAKDLNLAQNSPCEWYICDDDQTGTRYFVIQGSESIASWQANLLFEPVQFEGLDVLVHRGIYEAAKGIYNQMLPFIKSHLSYTGATSAKFQFTGHSLGGSLSLLINLMLITRGVVPASSLLPVITFGAPAVMCGGDYLLAKLGLGKDHLHAITMHRDIVPRAFSCNFPDNVARILKAVNGNFRNHPCLANQKILYAPMGKLVILQPDEKFSPSHHLLPPGCGLYLFNGSKSDNPISLSHAALSAFLNSPHPLEILSDRGAYGPNGTVYRDHDMNSYLKSIRCVIRHELKLVRKNKREQKDQVWWPLIVPSGADPCIIMGSPDAWSTRSGYPQKFEFSGMFRGGKENLRRFKTLVATRHVH